MSHPISEMEKTKKSTITRHSSKVRWMTRTMAEKFSREDILAAAFKETFIQIILNSCLLTWIALNSDQLVFRVSNAMDNLFTRTPFMTTNEVKIIYHDIRSPSDFWQYVDEILLPNLYWNSTDVHSDEPDPDATKIYFMYQMLGVARIRQVKVHNESCQVRHFFRMHFSSCYDLFTPQVEDRKPFGKENGTAWVYTSQEDTRNHPVVGRISTYTGGGYYLDFPTEYETARATFHDLLKNLWITRGTRAIFIDFSMYNANVNLFCICKLIFEFPPTGGIIPWRYIESMRLLTIDKTAFYITWVSKILVYICVSYSVCEEIREVLYERTAYIFQFWNYIDLSIIALTLGELICVIMLIAEDQIVKNVLSLSAEYANFEDVKRIKGLQNNFISGMLFFSCIKWFKYFSINQVFGQLNKTLNQSAKDVGKFMITFIIIFFAYAGLGYIIFHNSKFKSFPGTCFNLVAVLLGSIDYVSFEEANEIMAPIYFTSYILLVYFVLVNVFLAIINDTYIEVKTELYLEPEEVHMTEFVKNKIVHLLRKCWSCFYLLEENARFSKTMKKIDSTLKYCCTNEKIQEFYKRCGIDTSGPIEDDLIEKTVQSLERHAHMDAKDEEPEPHLEDFKMDLERIENIRRNVLQLVPKAKAVLRKMEEINEYSRDQAWN